MSRKSKKKTARRKTAMKPFTKVEQQAYDSGLTVNRGSTSFTKDTLIGDRASGTPMNKVARKRGKRMSFTEAEQEAFDAGLTVSKGGIKITKKPKKPMTGAVQAPKEPAKPKKIEGLPDAAAVYTFADVLQMDLRIDCFTGKVAGDINVLFDAEVYGLTMALAMRVVESALWPGDKLMGVVLELRGQDAPSAFGLLALYDWANEVTVMVAVPLVRLLELWGKTPPANAQKMIRLAVDAGYMRAWKLQSEKTKWERIGSL